MVAVKSFKFWLFQVPLHRAVVEATHPKNAPLAHLEASQYKNSRVSTALTRGRKPIPTKKKTKKGSKKKKTKTVDFAHLDAGQYKHSAVGLVDFHPISRLSFCTTLCPHRRCLSQSSSTSSPSSLRRAAPWQTQWAQTREHPST